MQDLNSRSKKPSAGEQYMASFGNTERAKQIAAAAMARGAAYMSSGFGGSARAQQVAADAITRGQALTPPPAVTPRAPIVVTAPFPTPGEQYMANYGGTPRAQQVAATAQAAGDAYMSGGFGGSARAQQVAADAIARGQALSAPAVVSPMARGTPAVGPTVASAPLRGDASLARMVFGGNVVDAATQGAAQVKDSWNQGDHAYAIGQAINAAGHVGTTAAVDGVRNGIGRAVGVVAPAVAPVIDVGRGVLGLGPMRAASATAAAGQETPVTANSGLSAQTAMQIAQGVTAAPAAAAAQPAQNAPNMFSSIEDVAKAYPNMQLGDYMQLAESLPRGSQAQPVSGKDLVYNRAIAFLDKESNDIQNSNWPEAEKAKALAIQYNKYVALISEMAALTANAQPE